MVEDTRGQISDEAVARLRKRVGVPVRNSAPPHYREPGLDAFRIVRLPDPPGADLDEGMRRVAEGFAR
jgi:hypothetical protein